ncbi:hypothetical protein GOODEAATRI_034513 [Goodea atripinnis]|uniref:Uncharacterized protein n=1 Tax=Goodea atripinnis TaxID=208336 RepID=A0ABV0P035_9TELE
MMMFKVGCFMSGFLQSFDGQDLNHSGRNRNKHRMSVISDNCKSFIASRLFPYVIVCVGTCGEQSVPPSPTYAPLCAYRPRVSLCSSPWCMFPLTDVGNYSVDPQ